MSLMEMLVVGVLALILIGPKQLPEMARVLGRLIAEFKKATTDLSGGLLNVKNELRQPFEDGLDSISKIRDDIKKTAVDQTVGRVTDQVTQLKDEIIKNESDTHHS